MITVNQNGSYTVNADLPIGSWLDGYRLSFGTLLEEVNPEDLRIRILSHMDALRSNLSSPCSR